MPRGIPQGEGAVAFHQYVRVLEQPELIAKEVSKQEGDAEEKRTEIGRQLAVIEGALAKCERETQRWVDTYTGEVINVAEPKAYREKIERRRQSILMEQAECQARLEAIGQAMGPAEALICYCARVHQRLQSFDHAEKRMALEALDIRVSWRPKRPLVIQGSIPLGEIVDSASDRTFIPRMSR